VRACVSLRWRHHRPARHRAPARAGDRLHRARPRHLRRAATGRDL